MPEPPAMHLNIIYTKFMPQTLPYRILAQTLILFITLLGPSSFTGADSTGIGTYYIRLDHGFSATKFTQPRVTMVPAENEFRAENFSLVILDGTLHTPPLTQPKQLAAMAKRDVFTKVLLSHGLKSVQASNHVTTVSYEGAVLHPVNITISAYEEAQEGFPYTANLNFSPIAFPDRWDALKHRYRVRQILNDFFLLFK